jgi:ribosomal-protein-alanine N-acetyltransferase
MISGIDFYLTAEQDHIKQCARMMAETDPWIELGLDYEKCLGAFDGPCKEIYILKAGGELAGFAILQICGTFKGYIQTICIDQRFRGQGLGTKILQFCEERILKISPNIFICVSSFNRGALKLYQQFGFKLIGELENFVKEGYTELLLRKTIGAIQGYKAR